METHERIRVLRLDQGLTQKQFGECLGVSRSVINNLERGVLVNPSNKLPLIKLMALKFSVSEEWLLTGETSSPEYIPSRALNISAFLSERGATKEEAAFIAAYFDLSESERRNFLRFCDKVLDIANSLIDRPQDESDA